MNLSEFDVNIICSALKFYISHGLPHENANTRKNNIESAEKALDRISHLSDSVNMEEVRIIYAALFIYSKHLQGSVLPVNPNTLDRAEKLTQDFEVMLDNLLRHRNK